MKALVIGSGVIGNSIAFYLARRGADVTILDECVNTNKATPGSFGWINGHRAFDPDYFALRMDSIRQWRDLIAEFPDAPVRLSGGLDFESPAELDSLALQYSEIGYPAEIVNPQQTEPELANLPDKALYLKAEGLADPEKIADWFLGKAIKAGAKLVQARVHSLDKDGRKIRNVTTDKGGFSADKIIVAAGIQSEALLATADVNLPMDNRPGLLLRTNKVKRFSDKMFCTPHVHFWQLDNGAILAGEDFGGSQSDDDKDAITSNLCKRLAEYLPHLAPFEVDSFRITTRPIPKDGLPVCCEIPDVESLFIASLHSGITLAPMMGSAIASMVLDGISPDLLKPYHISRFEND